MTFISVLLLEQGVQGLFRADDCIDSRGEIRELPRVQSTEQILLMPAAVYQV